MSYQMSFKFKSDMWARIAAHAITKIFNNTQKGIDREGDKFPSYSKSYADLKKSGFKSIITGKSLRGERLRGISLERQTVPPNFRLTRRTMNNLRPLAVGKYRALIGWQNDAANIVAAHEERGNYKVGGIDPETHGEIIKIADDYFVRQWNKQPKRINVKVGR